MIKRLVERYVPVIVVILGVNFIANAKHLPIKDRDLLNRRLANVQITAQSIESLFTELALSNNIPIGLEISTEDDEFVEYTLQLKNGSLSDLLDQFTSKHPQYIWRINDGVVNIFPKAENRAFIAHELLDAKIGDFHVGKGTSCDGLVTALFATEQVKKVIESNGIIRAGMNFSGGYFPQLGQQFTLDISNATVRSVLNTVVDNSPIAKIWVFKKYEANQSVFIRLNATNEGN